MVKVPLTIYGLLAAVQTVSVEIIPEIVVAALAGKGKNDKNTNKTTANPGILYVWTRIYGRLNKLIYLYSCRF
ncbi:MAG: hypothetical protein A2469_04560 [Candidatus Magasanikbacteria bacterium RIFOXYC2_FULL_40_16]|uniref:Uncharacterized protein n=2 Tax=Candidatus Magasanikiibacteriota TaxID=1752731 RepID=A0A1F6NH34_9BACT|nr:MAG: hypothetical protein A2373_04535 [Candidatus Magasanikbacteria bacterium RIFOXYB1_FULL_40_15]OGH89441.1 MAG: hypothetical protein A2469_04560 [Candidatus Magasanikbacteria bacterium RIFOXYC2_FULL_40_16]